MSKKLLTKSALTLAVMFSCFGVANASENSEQLVSSSSVSEASMVNELEAKSLSARVCPNSREAGYIGGDLFATASAKADEAELFLIKNAVKKLSNAFKGDNYLWLRVRSRTDSVGSDSYNKELSAKRSSTMLNALKEAGVDTRSVHVVNYGESKPVYTNKTVAGRAMNRSSIVEIYAMDKKMANECLRDYPNAVDKWKD